jgi:hypothetical protein
LYLYAGSQTTLNYVTITGNEAEQAGGIFVHSSPEPLLVNTIVAENDADVNFPEILGRVDSTSHHNICSEPGFNGGLGGNGAGGMVNGVNGNVLGVDPLLGSLASNGGPTPTCALLPGSPAFDAGAAISGVATDQRGLARPQGAATDVGAFEAIASPAVTVNPQSQAVPVGATATFHVLANHLYGGTAPSTLSGDAVLLPNQYLLSPNHAYQLLYQTDGNLVLYRGDGVPLWASGTAGQTPGYVIMQADGNLVIYGPGGVPQYATGTSGNPNAILSLQNDGNLVIYNTASVPIFATNTVAFAPLNPVPTVQWQVSTDHGATFTDIAGATGVSFSVTVGLFDHDNRYRATFSNASGVVVPTAPATLTVLTSLQVWRALQGLAADGAQDAANPSGDGVPNLLKYAFNLAPNAGDLLVSNRTVLPPNGTAGLPRLTVDATPRLVFQFVRRKAATHPGIGYVVQTSQDLSAWSALDLSAATVQSIDATWERVTVTDPISTAQRFGRVRVSVP